MARWATVRLKKSSVPLPRTCLTADTSSDGYVPFNWVEYIFITHRRILDWIFTFSRSTWTACLLTIASEWVCMDILFTKLLLLWKIGSFFIVVIQLCTTQHHFNTILYRQEWVCDIKRSAVRRADVAFELHWIFATIPRPCSSSLPPRLDLYLIVREYSISHNDTFGWWLLEDYAWN